MCPLAWSSRILGGESPALLPSNPKVGSLGSNCTGWKTWPSCPPCQQARWPDVSLFPLMLQSVHTESGCVDRHSQEKKTQEIRSLSFFLASCQHGTVTAVLTWQRQEMRCSGPVGVVFSQFRGSVCPWLSLSVALSVPASALLSHRFDNKVKVFSVQR